MKLNENFITYEQDGRHITVPVGNSSFNGLLRSNETAAFIIEKLKTETTEDEIVKALFDEYDAPESVIREDVRAIIEKLRSVGAIDE
ncbi:MAG: PqqD family protein [Clostridia bacterium]|nr:PqqD family protein [Clostridia bacterium]